MIKIGFLRTGHGTFIIYKDKEDWQEPYKIYMETFYQKPNDLYPKKHRKLLVKYADLLSVTAYIYKYSQKYC